MIKKTIKKIESKVPNCDAPEDCTDILYERMTKLQYEIISMKKLESRKYLVKVDNGLY